MLLVITNALLINLIITLNLNLAMFKIAELIFIIQFDYFLMMLKWDFIKIKLAAYSLFLHKILLFSALLNQNSIFAFLIY